MAGSAYNNMKINADDGFFTDALIGVLALQGDFEMHLKALNKAGCRGLEVRSVEDLEKTDGLIIPGGESTTVGKLMNRYGLDVAITKRAKQGMPVWGTCMGMIVIAKEIEGIEQPHLGLLDAVVRRNAFGRQIDSFETDLPFKPLNSLVRAVFIRAPIVTKVGDGVDVLSVFDNKIVCVQQGKVLGTSFHPELTDDIRVHQYFITMVVDSSKDNGGRKGNA